MLVVTYWASGVPFALTNSPLLGMTTIKPSSVALQIDSYYTHRDEDMLLCFHARELVPMAVKKWSELVGARNRRCLAFARPHWSRSYVLAHARVYLVIGLIVTKRTKSVLATSSSTYARGIYTPPFCLHAKYPLNHRLSFTGSTTKVLLNQSTSRLKVLQRRCLLSSRGARQAWQCHQHSDNLCQENDQQHHDLDKFWLVLSHPLAPPKI